MTTVTPAPPRPHPTRRRLLRPALLVAMSLSGLGADGCFDCNPTETGTLGALTFTYDTDDHLVTPNFKKAPLAVGLSADVWVRDADDGSDVDLEFVVSENVNALEIADTGAGTSRFVMSGLADGVATLAVQAGGSPKLSDNIVVEVRDIAAIEVAGPLPWWIVPAAGDPEAVILDGGIAYFPRVLRDTDGTALFGYGDVPVTVIGGAVQATESTRLLEILVGAPGTLTVGHDGVEVYSGTIIAQADVGSLVLQPLAASAAPGTRVDVAVSGLWTDGAGDEHRVQGLEGRVSVTSTTPAICTVEPFTWQGDGVHVAVTLAEGTCTLEATGLSLSTSVDIPIAEPAP